MACASARASASESGNVGISTKDKIHESAGIRLDDLEELGLRSGELLHKLVVEVRVLEDALANQTKVGVRSKRSEGVCTTGHSGTTDARALIFSFIAVVITTSGVKCLL
jgi:hypothetical protein